MLSVSLVLSLLPSYFGDLSISNEHYGLMSSAYSLSQIVGGLVLGALSDRVMSRRSVLVLSFVGSAVSYGTIALSSSLSMLLAGRVLVGLVKQTMTVSTAIVSEQTTAANRSAELSKLTAAMTFSGVAGPTIGSLLYSQNKKLPPMVASSLFLLNTVLALVLLPSERSKPQGDNGTTPKKKDDDENNDGGKGGGGESGVGRFLADFKLACRSGPMIRILVARLLFDFFMRSLGAQNFVGYFEERFNVDSGARGYMHSYTFGVNFLMQMYVVGRLTSRTSETLLVWASLAISTVMNLVEGTPSLFGLWGYLAIVIPARGVANACLSACLQSIFTQRVPQSDLGAALGALNVLKSASGVVGPLYGARLVGAWGVLARPTLTAVHYAGFFVLWWAMEVRGAAGGVSRGGGEGQGGSVDRMRSTERTKLK
ncbi:unnamed protein product [Ascophyllum nodosum]